MILAGDVGGTNTRLLLRDGGRIVAEERYPSREYGGLGVILGDFLARHGVTAERACLGVAGPVEGNRCRATNLPWEIDGAKLATELGIHQLELRNDFATVGLGLEALGPDDMATLNDVPADPDGPVAILGAGTGLGEGFLVPCGTRRDFVPSEGGHADLAPRTDREIGFLKFMLRSHRRVSYERALSGPGLGNLFRYVVDAGIQPAEATLRDVAAAEDLGAVVTRHALARDCPACYEAMDMFSSFYGAEAGNLALKVLATGGVYLAGGIAPRILTLLRTGPFMTAYGEKGRLSAVVRSYPVYVVTNPRIGLLGAALCAERFGEKQ